MEAQPFEPVWMVDWENIRADPLDGLSLYMMFEYQSENNEAPQEVPEWEWDPILEAYQLQAMDDPLDTFSLPMMFAEESQPEGIICDWLELAPLRPDFTHLSDSIVDNLYSNLNFNP